MIGTKAGALIVWDFLKNQEIRNLTEDIDYYSGLSNGALSEHAEKKLKGCPISVITTSECKIYAI